MRVDLKIRKLGRYWPWMASIGLFGWAALLWFTISGWSQFTAGQSLPLWLGFAAAARILAVPVEGRGRFAIDSAFYVACSFTDGALEAAWLVAVLLTVDRLFFPKGAWVKSRAPRWVEVVAGGGIPALSLLAFGLFFDLMFGLSFPTIPLVAIWVPIYSASFATLYYALAAVFSRFEGASARQIVRGFWGPMMAYELALIPLTVCIVAAYLFHGPYLAVLMSLSVLIFNVLFGRVMWAHDRLQERVHELSALNRIGRILTSSLDRKQLAQDLAESALPMMGEDAGFEISFVEHGDDVVQSMLYDRDGELIYQKDTPREGSFAGYVLGRRAALDIPDTTKVGSFGSEGLDTRETRSWMGAPLLSNDDIIGLISVQSPRPNAFSDEQCELLETIADYAAVALENARLFELATVDGLTGLLVRRHFQQRLEQEWNRANRYQTGFAVAILDLDNFKSVNDTYGHQTGDRVLRAAADVIARNMRGADVAGRYGGEEFAVVLPGTNLQDAQHVSERIRSEIARLTVRHRGDTVPVSVSIGVAAFPEVAAASANDLLAHADLSLYAAKAQGKNRVCVPNRAVNVA